MVQGMKVVWCVTELAHFIGELPHVCFYVIQELNSGVSDIRSSWRKGKHEYAFELERVPGITNPKIFHSDILKERDLSRNLNIDVMLLK
jgi:hypothetical protein